MERLKSSMCVDQAVAQLHERVLKFVDEYLKALQQSLPEQLGQSVPCWGGHAPWQGLLALYN